MSDSDRPGYVIEARLEGVAPLLFNGWSAEALDKLDSGVTGGKLSVPDRVAEAWGKLYWRDEQGEPAAPPVDPESPAPVTLSGVYLPRHNLKKCLLQACSIGNFKEGTRSLAPYLEATVFLDGDPTFDPAEVYIHRVWGRRPPRTGAAVVVRRPAIGTGWGLPIRVAVLDERRNAERLREVFETAGAYVGVGSWRGEYGRFRVAEWRRV